MQLVEKARIALLSISVLLFSYASLAEPVLLVVDAREIKDSKVTSGQLCEGDDCASWETYFIYKAKIQKLVYGNLSAENVIIAKSQHTGYVNKKIDDWMILIRKIEDPVLVQKLGAQYMVEESSFPEKYYCFDGKPSNVIDKLFVNKTTSSSDDYFCYSLDDLPE